MTLMRRNPQAWAKRFRVTSLNVDEMTSRYSCVLSFLSHYPIIPMLQTPTCKLFKVRTGHTSVAPKKNEARLIIGICTHPFPTLTKYSSTFLSQFGQDKIQNRTGGKIFHKLRPPGSPSFCIVY